MEMTAETRAMFAEAAGRAVTRATEAADAAMDRGASPEAAAGVFAAVVDVHRREFAAAMVRAVQS